MKNNSLRVSITKLLFACKHTYLILNFHFSKQIDNINKIFFFLSFLVYTSLSELDFRNSLKSEHILRLNELTKILTNRLPKFFQAVTEILYLEKKKIYLKTIKTECYI